MTTCELLAIEDEIEMRVLRRALKKEAKRQWRKYDEAINSVSCQEILDSHEDAARAAEDLLEKLGIQDEVTEEDAPEPEADKLELYHFNLIFRAIHSEKMRMAEDLKKASFDDFGIVVNGLRFLQGAAERLGKLRYSMYPKECDAASN